jgi:hypothetical protein
MDLSKYKSRDLIDLKCNFCGKTFSKTKNVIQINIKRCGTVNKFCSSNCKGNSRSKLNTSIVKCFQCGKNIKKKSHQIGIMNFCNHKCHALYFNSHKKFGYRRSKLEQWIEEQLTKLYPTLEIHYNKTDTINSELDIYIPSLKLAFELNGIFHYEPIYSQKGFERTKNNDLRKFQVCSEKGISLCIIDTYNVKYLKKERDKKFLDIIINHIDNKIV